MFIGSSMSFLPGGKDIPRRTKSAVDLQFLMFSENTSNEQDTLKKPEASQRVHEIVARRTKG